MVTNRQILFYALPTGAMALLYGGPLVVLQGIYAKYYGLSLTAIATILLMANVFDTVTDPIIGYWSDKLHASTGTRKPFILFGGILFVVGAYCLFVPPNVVSNAYFLIFFLVFYLGTTLFNIPHQAWGSEISFDSQSSTRVFTLRALMSAIGGMLFYSLPQLPFFETTEFTPQILKWAVVISGMLILPAMYLCINFVPNSYQPTTKKPHSNHKNQKSGERSKSRKILTLWFSISGNRPFLLFLGAFFLSGLGSGSWGALLFIYIDTYLNMGDKFSVIGLLGMGTGILGLRIWTMVAAQLGKIVGWILGIGTTIVSILGMTVLTPDNPSFTLLMLVMMPAFLAAISFLVFAPALLSDIIDYSTWKFGEDFAGTYFSAYSLIMKTNAAIGGAAGLAIAGWYGFDPSLSTHSQEAIWGLKLAAIWLPASLFLISIIFISRIPINSRRHAIICKALERRDCQRWAEVQGPNLQCKV